MTDGARFAHASEAELARILDYYEVRWEYEPRSFPILWNLDGRVVESFSPDFYLPELDLYVELTTLKQTLVRKKNRKLRRLRELYPWIRIKLFYAKDFKALMLKYGRIELAASYSGLEGQAHVRDPRAGGAAPAVQLPPVASAAAALATGTAPTLEGRGEADLPAAGPASGETALERNAPPPVAALRRTRRIRVRAAARPARPPAPRRSSSER